MVCEYWREWNMEILLILSGGGFIAYVIISALRVRKFNKTHEYQQQELSESNDDLFFDPVYSSLSCNIFHKDE